MKFLPKSVYSFFFKVAFAVLVIFFAVFGYVSGVFYNNLSTLETNISKRSKRATPLEERKKVFLDLTSNSPKSNFESRPTITVVWDQSWDLNQLETYIIKIAAEINHLKAIYTQRGGKQWPVATVVLDGIKLPTLKAAQDAITTAKNAKVFEALVANKPVSPFEGKDLTIKYINTWNLNQLNNAVKAITTEITRLEGIHTKYGGKQWPTKTVNTDGRLGNNYPTLKAAQDAVTTAKIPYDKEANIFKDLVANGPVSPFEGKDLTIKYDNAWTLKQLNTYINEIINEITRYSRYSGPPVATVVVDKVGTKFPTLKAAQDAVTRTKNAKVFKDLVANGPVSPFEGKDLTIKYINTWNLNQLNKAITAVTAEITRLKGIYTNQYGGKQWPVATDDTDGDGSPDFPTLKAAQDAITTAKNAKVFEALVANKPVSPFEGKDLTIKYINTWNLNQLNNAVKAITTEITRLKGIHTKYGGKQWPAKTVNSGGVDYPTLKVAQDAVRTSKTPYDKRANVFKALIVDKPTSSFESRPDITVAWDDKLSFSNLGLKITAITDEITHLEKRYRQYYSRIIPGGPADKWPAKTVDTDGDGSLDYPTLKVAQDAVTTTKMIYNEQAKVFDALVINSPTSRDGTWDLNQLNTRITEITAEITRLKGIHTQYGGKQWPVKTVDTDGDGSPDFPTLKVAQDAVRTSKTPYDKRVNIFNALVINSPTSRDGTWDLNQLNTRITEITAEITRLKGIHTQYGGKQWPVKTIDTDGDGSPDFPTLKVAQDAVRTSKTPYDKRANVFKALIVDKPTSPFESKDLTIKYDNAWTLKQLNTYINEIINEITRYSRYSGRPVKTVDTDGDGLPDFPTLKVAQDAVTKTRNTKNFKALVVDKPTSPFESKDLTIKYDNAWNLNQLKNAVKAITTEITRLEGIHTKYGGKQWPVVTVVVDGKKFPTLKVAQDAVTTTKLSYDKRANIFKALIIDKPTSSFESRPDITVAWDDKLSFNDLDFKIKAITTEITHLKSIYIRYGGKQWPVKTVDTDGDGSLDFPTLKAAQDAAIMVKASYDKRANIFEALVANKPKPHFEGEDINIKREDTWTLEQLNAAILAITTKITALKSLYYQYSGITAGALDDNWPSKTINTDNTAGEDYPTLKAVQDEIFKLSLKGLDALKQLREIYINLGGIKSLFPVFQKITSLKINITNAFRLVEEIIKKIKDQEKFFLALTGNSFTPDILIKAYKFTSSDTKTVTKIVENLFEQNIPPILGIPSISIVEAVKKTKEESKQKTNLKLAFLAKGGKKEDWSDSFTLQEATDKEKEQDTIFAQARSLFTHLMPNQLETLYGGSTTIVPYPGDVSVGIPAWNIEKFILESDKVLSEIERLSELYIKWGGKIDKLPNGDNNPNDWTNKVSLRYVTFVPDVLVNKNYADVITLQAAQEKLTDLIKEINELHKQFVSLTTGASNLKKGVALPIWPANDSLGIPQLDFDQATNNVDTVNKEINLLKQEFLTAQGTEQDWGTPTLQEAKDQVALIRVRKQVLFKIYSVLRKASDKPFDKTWDLKTVTTEFEIVNNAILTLKLAFDNLGGINWPGINPVVSKILSVDDILITHEQAANALTKLKEEIKNKKTDWESLKGAATQIGGVNILDLPQPLSLNIIKTRIIEIKEAIKDLKTKFDKFKGKAPLAWTDTNNNSPNLEDAQKKVKDLFAKILIEKNKYETLTAGLKVGDTLGVTKEIKYAMWPVDGAGNPTISLTTAQELVEQYEQEMIRLKTVHQNQSGTEIEWNTPNKPTSIVQALTKIATAKVNLWSKIKSYIAIYNKIYERPIFPYVIDKDNLNYGLEMIKPSNLPQTTKNTFLIQMPLSDFESNKNTYNNFETWNITLNAVKKSLQEVNKLKKVYDDFALSGDNKKWKLYDLKKISKKDEIHTTIADAMKKIDDLKKLIDTEKIHFDYLTNGGPLNSKITDRDVPVFIAWPENGPNKLPGWAFLSAKKQKDAVIREIFDIHSKFKVLGGTEELGAANFGDPKLPWGQGFLYHYDAPTNLSSGITLKQAQDKLNHLIEDINKQKKLYETAYAAFGTNVLIDVHTLWPADDAAGIPVLNLDEAKKKVEYWGSVAILARLDAIAEKYEQLGGEFKTVTREEFNQDATWVDPATAWPIIANNFAEAKLDPTRWMIKEAQAQRKLQSQHNIITSLKKKFEDLKGKGNDAATEYKDKTLIMIFPTDIDWGNSFIWLLGKDKKSFDINNLDKKILDEAIAKMSEEIANLETKFETLYKAQGYAPWQSETADAADVADPWTTPISLPQARAKVAYWAPIKVTTRIKKLFEFYWEVLENKDKLEILVSAPPNGLSSIQRLPSSPWTIVGYETPVLVSKLKNDNIAYQLSESEAEAKLRFRIKQINQKRADFLKSMKGIDYNHPLLSQYISLAWPKKSPTELLKDEKKDWIFKNAIKNIEILKLFLDYDQEVDRFVKAFLALKQDNEAVYGSGIYVQDASGIPEVASTPLPLKNKKITLAQIIAKYDYWKPFALAERIRDWRERYYGLKGSFSYDKSVLKKDDTLLSDSSAWPMSSASFDNNAPIILNYHQAKAKLEWLVAQRIVGLYNKKSTSNQTTVIALAVSTAIFGVITLATLGWIGYSYKIKNIKQKRASK